MYVLNAENAQLISSVTFLDNRCLHPFIIKEGPLLFCII